MMNNTIKKKCILNNVVFYLKIWSSVYPPTILLCIIAIPAQFLSNYCPILLTKVIIGGVENNHEIMESFGQLAVIALILIASSTTFSFISMKFMAKGTEAKAFLYRTSIYDKTFSMKYETFMKNEIQTKVSKINEIISEGDTGVIHQFMNNIISFFSSLIGILLFSTDIYKINYKIILIIFTSFFIKFFYGIKQNKIISNNIEQRSEYRLKIDYLSDLPLNSRFYKDIRLYKMQNLLSNLHKHYLKKWAFYILKEEKVKAGAMYINSILVFFRDYFSYLFLVYQHLNGQISVSDFVYLSGLTVAFSNWTNEIINQINSFIEFSNSIDHIRDYLEIEENDDHHLKDIKISNTPTIDLINVSYKYSNSNEWILKNINLSVSFGEKIAIVGNNGAGKTTLMLLLMGLLEPTKGSILIDGIDTRSIKKTDYYSIFSPVFQELVFFPESLYANIAGNLDFNEYYMNKVIKLCKLDKLVNDLPSKGSTFLVKNSRDDAIDLSGGQEQLLLLARATYKNGKIFILDEPTASLDPLSEERIYYVFYKDISRDNTSFFISHRLASTKFCSKIIFLENGRIIEEGSHSELLALDGKYAFMYKLQCSQYRREN